jgi:beta-glucosidase
MKKCLFFFVFIVLSFMATGCSHIATNPCDIKIGAHAEVTPVAQEPNLVSWWPSRHKAVLERIEKGNVDLVMIGDSITHGWEKRGKNIWDKYYANRNAVNLGFGGDRTQHVLWRIQNGEIDGISPKLVVLMIGTNNSGGKNISPEQISDGIKAIVCVLRNKLPNTKILVLGIFPRGSVKQRKDKNDVNDGLPNPQWAKLDTTNELISKIADNKMIYYLNINKVFLNTNGEVSREALPDLLHPSEKGYNLWAQAMEPTVKQLMGEK